ncbi:hypothetical protein CHGG_03048 [Chaetomium globosum CBS 148.51]|uniref:DUF1640 domain-containing protein n=1 Tax=Chaetomium globosum (strain ATCC 6205 / CBS 148.51 / DSM 1962 / NBRC 6347 / NRRL 1970) TaxID=306901 RepID=Q2H9Q6_CHAGB|nr:uncharacterized protein CHGG_03048 [Chaetomium globosum CBS 148.51]EAQ91113.1 hypothetical protein CHGG_03048 [Chaetomium globosum CBS 148.51]
MATNRLTFLYPHLCRAGGRLSEPTASQALRNSRRNPSVRPQSCQHATPFTTASARRQPAFAKRAGKGIEPLQVETPAQLPNNEGEAPGKKPDRKPDGKLLEGRPDGKAGGKTQEGGPKGQIKGQNTGEQTPHSKPTPQPTEPPPSRGSPTSSHSPSAESGQKTTSPSQPDLPKTIELPPPGDIDPITQAKKGSPMDEILHMGPPPDSLPGPPPNTIASEQPSNPTPQPATDTGRNDTSTKPPHLVPTAYIHHFDSYTLVKQLTTGGYTLPQAILSMKAIRKLLASNLDVAQSGLVSKADVENETYLFRAACSELGAEVHNNRRVADEQLRQQRTLLQHEVDILAQRLNQELLTLTDSVRGMFNDRRMAVREEQKSLESRIQQINYKISVTLNSDAKSDIEGLRWVLIRRSVLGIIFMAVLTLGTIRYTTYISHQRQKEADQQAKEAEEIKKNNGRSDYSPGPDAAEILAAN